MSDNPLALGNPGATLESIVREELRPILKAWLDQNLTTMVFGYQVKPNFTVQNEAAISTPPAVSFDKPAAPAAAASK